MVATAETAGDRAHAAETLSSVRAIGSSLAVARNEHMVADAVSAIDAANLAARSTLNTVALRRRIAAAAIEAERYPLGGRG